jgi:aerobic-type carbon monoxide dehydrogenase small subunit (CoxS/CutS family)
MIEAQGKNPAATQHGFTRRKFLKGVGAAGVGAIVVDPPLSHSPAAEAAPAPAPAAAPAGQILKGPQALVLNVNGQDRTVNVEPRTTLLNALRNTVEPPVTGPKLVCDMGTCGACTVLLDDKPVYGCLTLAIRAVGHKITTAEGIGSPDKMSPVQAAFVEKDAMMCGFCTSGFVTSITGLLKQNPDPTLEQVKEYCKGNFCRCGTYPHIFEAALAAAKASKA